MVANLRMDPFERPFDKSIGYGEWWVAHMFVFAPAGAYAGQWLQSFRRGLLSDRSPQLVDILS